MPRLQIPTKLLLLNPDLNEKELRCIIRVILNSKSMKLRTSHILNFTVPHLGRFKTHGGKKVKRYKKDLVKDRKKKKNKYDKLLMTKERLLW